MTPEQFKERMLNISKEHYEEEDEEDSHRKMDKLMCEVLVELGYKDGVDIFKNMPKYYA